MKTIGLIGGMSWESTVTYYQLINEAVKAKPGGLHSAKILLYSVNFAQIERYQAICLKRCKRAGIDTADFKKMWNSEAGTYADSYSAEQRTEIICAVKEQLPPDEVQAAHFADILLQNIELGKYINDSAALNEHRDQMMAENVLWILQQEQARGSNCIMLSGHNNHIMQCQNAESSVLGSLLAEKLGDGYFAIGADFYKSVCNLPKPYTGKRITHTFYSHDPLAKASKRCGFAASFLDFSKVPGDSPLAECISSSIPMGSLGESYSVLMNFIPRSYRVSRTPQQAYDAMIFVADAAPIEISPASGE